MTDKPKPKLPPTIGVGVSQNFPTSSEPLKPPDPTLHARAWDLSMDDPTLHDQCPLCGQLPKAMVADADRWTWIHADGRECMARRGPKGWERV